MLKQIASLVLIVTMLCTFCGTYAFAQTLPAPEAELNKKIGPVVSGSEEKNGGRQGASLKAEMSKLVANAKADKGLSVAEWQIQPKQSNSLSKGAKIAIIAGAAVIIILIIVVVHEKNHLFDDFRLGN